jgi:hypothetical protein
LPNNLSRNGRRFLVCAATKPKKMISFASFAPPLDDAYVYEDARHLRATDDDENNMDLDLDDDEFASGSKLTCPGETLTSSHAFMRYAPSEIPTSDSRSAHFATAAMAPTSTTTRSFPQSQAPSSA